MSEPLAIALIASVPPTLAAVAALIVGVRNSRKVEQVHRATNSMKDALVLAAGKEGYLAGMNAERKRGRRKA